MLRNQKWPLVIDCDTGRDDAIALWYCLAVGLQPKAVIATYGNTPQSNVLRNCLDVLSLADCTDVPVWAGMSEPSQPHRLVDQIVKPRQAQSGNGLCDVVLPKSTADASEIAIDELASRLKHVAAKVGPLDYLILGPATTAWKLMECWGDSSSNIIRHFTMLGGRLGSLWEQTPVPDFNIACDPFALKGLLSGISPVRMVTLNTTWDIQLPLESIRRLVARSVVGETAKTLMERHCLYFSTEPVFRFHDPVTVHALLHEAHFHQACVDVNLDESDKDFGRLIVSESNTDKKNVGIFSTGREFQSSALTSILNACDLS